MSLKSKTVIVPKLHLVIATAGRSHLLARCLESLTQCVFPPSLGSVVVVENGGKSHVEDTCIAVKDRLPIQYQYCGLGGKNAAINLAIEQIVDDDLVVFCDDDIRFSADYLMAYHHAFFTYHDTRFYGGPFDVDYQSAPPPWLIPYLPLSAKGWDPIGTEIDAQRTWFLGFNWAATRGSIRRAGGFDPSIGPGSPSNSTGDEVMIQKQMLLSGMQAHYVPSAKVWHYVPSCRCSPEWVLDRAYRNGMARGQYVRQRRGLRLVAGHFSEVFRYATASIKLRGRLTTARPGDFPVHFDLQKSRGYYDGFRAA